MKNFTPPAAFLRLILICIYALKFSISDGAEIIFQHNFENLDNPPTDAQLGSPNIINPDLTNIFLNSGLLYRTRTDAGQKALSITASGNSAVYVLLLQVPKCKRLSVSSISFKGFASDNATFSIAVNNVAYGAAVSSAANAYTNVAQNKNINTTGSGDFGFEYRIEITVSSTKTGTVSSIDDLTINGQVTNAISKLETIIFPNSTGAKQLERCPNPSTVAYFATLNTPSNQLLMCSTTRVRLPE